MGLSPEIWAVIAQTVVLVVGFIAFMVRREHRLTKVEGRLTAVESAVRPIPGISRKLAHLEGRNDRPAT